MQTVLGVFLVECASCALMWLWAKRRGAVTLLAHWLVLDLGWLVGVWARQARLQTLIVESSAAGTVEDISIKCVNSLSALGPLYRGAACNFLVMPDQAQVLQYFDPEWWLGGILGILMIALPAILFFWISLLAMMALGYLLPLNGAQDVGQALQCILGFVIGRNRPYYLATEPLIADGQLVQTFGGKIVPRWLGPGVIVANSHYAVPMINGPDFTRVGAPRLIFSRRRERPLQVVDLRPYIRPCSVKGTTKDGIEIETRLFLVFKIDPHGMDKPENNPHNRLYPFSEQAVFAAIRAQKSDREKTHLWDDYIYDLAQGIACDVFSQYRFDEIQGTAGRSAVRGAIHDRVREIVGSPDAAVNSPSEWRGIQVLFVGMSNIEATSANVADWRIEEWRAPRIASATEEKARGEAAAARTLNEVRAQAQSDMLDTLVRALENIQSLPRESASAAIILRSVEALEGMIEQSPSLDQGESKGALAAARRRARRG